MEQEIKGSGWPFWGFLRENNSFARYGIRRYLELGDSDPFGGLSAAAEVCFSRLERFSTKEIIQWMVEFRPLIEEARGIYFKDIFTEHLNLLKKEKPERFEHLPSFFTNEYIKDLFENWERLMPNEPRPPVTEKSIPAHVAIHAQDYVPTNSVVVTDRLVEVVQNRPDREVWQTLSVGILLETCRAAHQYKFSRKTKSDLLALGRSSSSCQIAAVQITNWTFFGAVSDRKTLVSLSHQVVEEAVKKNNSAGAVRASDEAHKEGRECKNIIYKWMDENRHKYRYLEEAADAAHDQGLVPYKRRTIRDWTTDWNKEKSAKPTSELA